MTGLGWLFLAAAVVVFVKCLGAGDTYTWLTTRPVDTECASLCGRDATRTQHRPDGTPVRRCDYCARHYERIGRWIDTYQPRDFAAWEQEMQRHDH